MRACLLIVFLLLCNLASRSQDIKDTALVNRFYKAGLATAAERTEWMKEAKRRARVEKEMDEEEDESYVTAQKSAPHYPLSVLTLLKTYSTPGVRTMIFQASPVEIPKAREKQVISQLGNYSKKLLAEKLISDRTYAELIKDIDSLLLRSEFEVLAIASFATEKEYFLAPPKFKKFADDLLKRKLITAEKHGRLLDRSTKGELRTYVQPLKYIDSMIWIDGKNAEQPEIYLEQLYRDIARSYPAVAFDTFKYSIKKNEKESGKDFIQYDITVTLQKNGKSYVYTSFWDAEYKNKQKEESIRLPEQFYQVFNKMLADQLSPVRLHAVSAIELEPENQLALLPLTKEQFEGLEWSYDAQSITYLDVSYENFTNKITQQTIDEAIALYDSIGLLSHLTKREKDSCILAIAGKEINYYSDILGSFKDLVLDIDLEYGIDNKQYEALTRLLAKISKAAFRPEAIIDTYDYKAKKSFDYGFTLQGKPYKTRLRQEDDWLDVAFFEFIDMAMAEHDKKGKFHTLYPSDGARLIYLTYEQAEVLRKRKLIELSEEDVSD